jgi:hypothetical protein
MVAASELHEANRGVRLDDTHVLSDPNLIWPRLRLRIPSLDRAVQAAETRREELAPEPAADPTPIVWTAADRAERASRPTLLPEPAALTPAASVAETLTPMPTAESTPAPPAIATSVPEAGAERPPVACTGCTGCRGAAAAASRRPPGGSPTTAGADPTRPESERISTTDLPR